MSARLPYSVLEIFESWRASVAISFDFETHLIAAGCQLPPAVCMSWTQIVPCAASACGIKIGASGVVTAPEGVALLQQALDAGLRIVGANTAFDSLVSVVKAADFMRLLRSWATAYEGSRIHDVFVRQKLLNLAAGTFKFEEYAPGKFNAAQYNLAAIALKLCGRKLSKPANEDDDTHWRLRFSELDGVPIADYPQAAYDYALEDAIATAEVFIAQEVLRWKDKRIARNFPGKDPFFDEPRQTIACVPLKAMSAYGLRTDPAAVERLAEEVEEKIVEAREDLITAGLVRPAAYSRNTDRIVSYIRRTGQERFFLDGNEVKLCKANYTAAATANNDGYLYYLAHWKVTSETPAWRDALVAEGLVEIDFSRDTKIAQKRCADAYRAQGLPVPHTDKYDPKVDGVDDKVSLDADACTGSEDPILVLYSEYQSLAKTLSNDIPMLRSGAYMPVHSRFDELKETGRTGSSKPNVQNVRRLPGIRECFKPRAGFCFVDTDFSMLELHTLAQVCLWVLGFSTLAEALNAGRDPHLEMAAKILKIDYKTAKERRKAGDSEVDNARTAGKGCFHPDTEVLTREGWVKVGELTMQSLVCSAKFDGDSTTLEYAPPLALTTRDWDGELVHLKNEGIDLRLTPDHRMVGWKGDHRKTELVTCVPEEVPRLRYWPNAGMLEGEIGAEVDERLLRLAVAAQADGHIMENGRLKFGFTKQRKIDRLVSLLRDDSYERSNVGKLHVETFRLGSEISAQILALLDEKKLPEWWTRLSGRCREIVLNEVNFWDSSCVEGSKRAGYTYYSAIRQNVEVLQTIATLTNRKTRLTVEDRTGRGHADMYSLSVKSKHRSRGGNVEAERIPYVGKVFCLTTHNDSVVVRDRGVPAITRQCNFGAPGGLSAPTFVVYAWTNYRIRLTLEQAQELIDLYRSTWVEMPSYFRWIKGHQDPYFNKKDEKTGRQMTRYNIVQPWSQRLRAHASYCAACNSPFQGLGADVAKLALWLVWKATMGLSELGEADPLYGCRIVNFVHDSIMTEVPIARAHAAAMRQKELMDQAGRMVLPDVPVKADMLVTYQWSKKAQQTRVACPVCSADGNCDCNTWSSRELIPWDLRKAVREALGKFVKKAPAERVTEVAKLRSGLKWAGLELAERAELLTDVGCKPLDDLSFEYLKKKEWPSDVAREAIAEMFQERAAA